MKIKLPIFFQNDHTRQMAELDLPWSFANCDVRDVIFYEITAISPFEEDGEQFTDVWSGNFFFTCQLPLHIVEQQIDLIMKDELNGENITKVMVDYEEGTKVNTNSI